MLVFFDAGGTLIAPRASVGEIYAGLAAEFEVVADANEVERAFRRAFAAAPPLAFPGAQGQNLYELEQGWWRDIVRQAFASHRFRDFESFFQALYREFAEPGAWRVFDDVIPALEGLRSRGAKLGVISNFDARLEPLLDGLGLASFFDSITHSSATGWAKPDPRLFEHALRLHGARAGDAVHIGDSEREDLAGARAAGMRSFLIRSNGLALADVLHSF